MSKQCAAVIDIGKTNKKVMVYDQDYRILTSEERHIPEREEGDLLLDDIEGIAAWMSEALATVMREFPIGVIAVSTHGAALVHIDENGERAFPGISYSQSVSDAFDSKFYSTYGSELELYCETAAPPLGGLLNSGRQFVWLKERDPEAFARIHRTLCFPQYLSRLLCGESALEISSIGTHSYLWNFADRQWSSLVKQAGITPFFNMPFKQAWEPLGTLQRTGRFDNLPDGECRVAVGIHDSNAALLPYLLGNDKPFVIMSTGTWMVVMRPRTPFTLQDKNLRQGVLYYLDAFGEPVKATLAMSGAEFDHYRARFAKECPPDDGSLSTADAINAVLASDVYILPTLHPDTGQFPDSKGRIVNESKCLQHPEFAMQALNLSMVIQSVEQLRILYPDDTTDVVLEGGFTKNVEYLGMLAACCPERKFFKREDTQGTSLGTAVCAFAALKGVTPDRIHTPDIWNQLIPVKPMSMDNVKFHEYQQQFLNQCRSTM
jgi:L-fuculokinase